MTDILPIAGWPNVRQLETNEFASGGANGNMNEQAKSLAARSELLKQYAALPYESKTSGYALNERVQLATGDIVRSTIAGNVNNPNVNMTGWVNVAAWSSIESKPELYTKTEADTLFVEASQIGQPNGVAGLDALGKLDSSKFPLATETALGVAKIATTAIAQAGTNDTDFITARKLKETALGFSQTWKNVTPSRTSGVTYTNTTGRPISVHVATVGVGGGESYLFANVGGVSFKFSRGGAASSSNFTSDCLIVPIGSTYILTTQNASINEWMELS